MDADCGSRYSGLEMVSKAAPENRGGAGGRRQKKNPMAGAGYRGHRAVCPEHAGPQTYFDRGQPLRRRQELVAAPDAGGGCGHWPA